MAEDDYDRSLKDNINKLSGFGRGIDELSSMERPLRILGEHEVALHELAKSLNDVKNEIKNNMSEQRAAIDAELERCLGVTSDCIAELSDVDSVLIDKISKIERVLLKMDGLGEGFTPSVSPPASKPASKIVIEPTSTTTQEPEMGEEEEVDVETRAMELESERDGIEMILESIKEDYNGGLMSKDSYERAARENAMRIKEIESELKTLQNL